MYRESLIWRVAVVRALVTIDQRSAGLRPISISKDNKLSPEMGVRFHIGLAGVLYIIPFSF